MKSKTTYMACAFSVVLASLGVGCGDDAGSGGGGGDDDGGSTTAGGGTKCYSVPVNQQNDGSSACGPEVCSGGEYCASDVGICDPGCTSELNCPRNQYCDKSNAGADEIGLCRAPGADLEKPCSGMTGDCNSRCGAKASACGAPAAQAEQACNALCPGISEQQIVCLEETTCEELEALQMGTEVCGIQPPTD
ncbi:MAG: hypothetical protein HOV80_05670 [Polyangiaceae bacterium]|nr:hypothetical protein [Polyangiaceae bacterium]